MGSIVSRTLSVGQEHELLQKLESAGLTELDAQKVIDSPRNKLAKAVVAFIRGGDQPSGDVYELQVNYDDPGHHTLNPDEYSYVEGGLTEKDFPVRGTGEVDVMYEYVTFDQDPTTQEVLDEIERRGNLRVPDFAETRDFHAQNPGERKGGWIVSLCGVVTRRKGGPSVASVHADAHGLDLGWGRLDNRWLRSFRFLAVRQA